MSVSDIMADIELLLQHYRNPGRRDLLLGRIATTCEALTRLPKEPPPGLIDSMCLRYAHDFGLDKNPASPISSGWTETEREALRRTMRQLYEEVAGYGYHRP